MTDDTGDLILQRVLEEFRREGTPKSMEVAHDLQLITNAWKSVLDQSELDWHNTALEMFARANAANVLLDLEENPLIQFEIVTSIISSFFYAGYLVGEGIEHIGQCRCSAKEH